MRGGGDGGGGEGIKSAMDEGQGLGTELAVENASAPGLGGVDALNDPRKGVLSVLFEDLHSDKGSRRAAARIALALLQTKYQGVNSDGKGGGEGGGVSRGGVEGGVAGGGGVGKRGLEELLVQGPSHADFVSGLFLLEGLRDEGNKGEGQVKGEGVGEEEEEGEEGWIGWFRSRSLTALIQVNLINK